MKFSDVVTESGQYKVTVTGPDHRGFIRFVNSKDQVMSWMVRTDGRVWKGFTLHPTTTGIKKGSKAFVADWCLDWAANGF
ncbi:hypothetical protein Dthio_PD1440 [Desulfonatronospira thiodismutans ASO3-1]|uniref:Uncharacterized protein n=1 Tax=Desulfonatronospira thiodismutans ASO3-1 TaxID=555779 RepID=D6STT4_9BACT|nr:hypothetical protein Dthio_PD1440 [Desulfonatronospira thiodismutans ASO3-1]